MAFTTLKTVTLPILKGLTLAANYTPEIGTMLLNPHIDLSNIDDFKFTRIDSPIQDSVIWGNNMDSIRFFYNNKWEDTQPSRDALLRLNGVLPANYKDAVINLNNTTINITLLRDEDTGRICMKNSGGVIFQCQVLKEDDTIGTYSLNSSYQSASLPLTPSGGLTYTGSQFFGNVAQINAVEGVKGGKIFTTTKVFRDAQSAKAYLEFGDDSGEIGGGTEEEPAEDRTTVLYYNDRVSVTTFGFNDTTDYFTHSIQFKIQYKTNAGEKITEPRNSIVGYVKNSVDPVTFSNIEWVYNANVKIVECKWSYGIVGGTKHTGQIPPAGHIPDIMCFYDQVQIDNKVYKAKFGTNMVIFANKSDAERFAEGDKTVRPLYDGHSGRFDDTGDIGDKYSYNTQSYTIDNDMSSVWILTKEQLNELASVLATGLTKSEAESGQTLLNITKTTARSFTAQAEPVDMICDLFWVPIDVSEFCITHTDHLQFGQDTYGAAGALDEFVDETTGQVVKAARTSSRSIEALTGGIFETIGSAVSDSKLNVRSESVTPPPSNT